MKDRPRREIKAPKRLVEEEEDKPRVKIRRGAAADITVAAASTRRGPKQKKQRINSEGESNEQQKEENQQQQQQQQQFEFAREGDSPAAATLPPEESESVEEGSDEEHENPSWHSGEYKIPYKPGEQLTEEQQLDLVKDLYQNPVFRGSFAGIQTMKRELFLQYGLHIPISIVSQAMRSIPSYLMHQIPIRRNQLTAHYQVFTMGETLQCLFFSDSIFLY